MNQWFDILLNIKIPEAKANDYQIEYVDSPLYIKEYLEEAMKLDRNMRGFESLRALYLFEKSEKIEAKANELEEKTGKCYDGYRQSAAYLRSEADMAEEEYKFNKKQMTLFKSLK